MKKKFVVVGAMTGTLIFTQSALAAGLAVTPSKNTLSVQTGEGVQTVEAVPAYLYQDNNEWLDSLKLNQVIFMSGHGDGSSQYENIILYVFEVTVANNYYSENGYFIFEYTNAVRNGNGEFMIGRNNPELRYVCGQDFDSLYNDVMQNTQVQYNSELLEGINLEENMQ